MNQSKISNEAVKKATGKTWPEWFKILDGAGAKRLPHRDIIVLIRQKYLNKDWWSQMVTVEYERTRGLRSVNQNADGFLVAVHKTVPMSLTGLQKKWQAILKLPAVAKKKLERLPSKTKRAMIFYKADVGKVVVSFDAREKNKSRIMVESVKLPNKTAVESARDFWKKILDNNL